MRSVSGVGRCRASGVVRNRADYRTPKLLRRPPGALPAAQQLGGDGHPRRACALCAKLVGLWRAVDLGRGELGLSGVRCCRDGLLLADVSAVLQVCTIWLWLVARSHCAACLQRTCAGCMVRCATCWQSTLQRVGRVTVQRVGIGLVLPRIDVWHVGMGSPCRLLASDPSCVFAYDHCASRLPETVRRVAQYSPTACLHRIAVPCLGLCRISPAITVRLNNITVLRPVFCMRSLHVCTGPLCWCSSGSLSCIPHRISAACFSITQHTRITNPRSTSCRAVSTSSSACAVTRVSSCVRHN